MMPFKFFEFLEQFMIGVFLITLTQIEKTGSMGSFIPLEIQKLTKKNKKIHHDLHESLHYVHYP